MNLRKLSVVAALASAIAASPLAARALIVDGAHSGGYPNFFFLAPVVPAPSYAGTFDPALAPVVEILDLQTGAAVATFTTAGTGAQRVRVDAAKLLYTVAWRTADFALDTTRTYRIRVTLGDTVLGIADVAVVRLASQLRTVDTRQFVPVLLGTTLPINFTILRDAPQPPPASCQEIHQRYPGAFDGVYTIEPAAGAPIQVRCLQSVDGGGWTLVANFPWPGNTNGVPGWTSGNQVGGSFVDLAQPFKLSDAAINALKTVAYRGHGTATTCFQSLENPGPGPCAVDTTLYWAATCQYDSGWIGASCADPYLDPDLTVREVKFSDATACPWHFGLVASVCAPPQTAAFGSSHEGDHVFVGELGSFVHAYDGRFDENPSVQVWVK